MRPGQAAPARELGRDVVLLSVPADGAYLGVLRTAAAGLAARLHFTLDEIEDLRIAVDEACAMLIGAAAAGALLRCQFAMTSPADPASPEHPEPRQELSVELAVPAEPGGSLPATSSITWRMLTALTDAVSAEVADESATITLTARYTPPA